MATSSSASEGLPDIVVTAQKRAQTLQEVPVSVAVISADSLREDRITTVTGLATAVPNLAVSATPFQPFVAIRGLGSGGGSRALEQSVATYIDGVYAGRPNQFLNPYFDVERVEVVRGPQGVLFGINANAGGINIVNKKADTGKFEGYVSAGYEFANQGYNFEGGVSVPVSPTLGLRVAGRIGRDGAYLDNLVSGKEDGQEDHEIGRAILSWRPDSPFKADLGYEYSSSDRQGTTFQSAYVVPGVFDPVEDGDVDYDHTTPAGSPNRTKIKSHNVSLNMSYDTDIGTFSSSTGYSAFKYSQSLTPPGTAFVGTVYADEKFKQFYQEVRLASSDKGAFQYIVGGTYLHQSDSIPQGLDVSFAAFGAPGLTSAVRNDFQLKNDTIAAFVQGTYKFTPELSLTAGVRYSTVKKDVDYTISAASFGDPLTGYTFNPMSAVLNGNFGWMTYVNPADPSTVRPTFISRSRRFNAWNPSVSVNWEFSRRLSAYASFTTGTKSGGFNDQEKSGLVPENGFVTDPFAFNSEKARNVEAGFKFAGPRARFNAAVFHSKYKDMQVSQPIGNGVVTSNAGSAHATGVELDAQVLVADGLTLSGDFAYVDGKYDDFPGAGCIPGVPCNPATTNGAGGTLIGLPKVTGSARAVYEVNISGDLNLRLQGRAYYNDGAQWTAVHDPKTRTPSYWTFDAGVTLAQDDKGWSLSLLGKNLSNEVVQGYLLPALSPVFGYQVVVSPGRQFFLDLRYTF
ncbi:TonB-dependent receptor [Sphingomonas bisphenolicum]|uniref:TonB-dependent receptor n=2 Tax=Sphingomonas bisphenolicum TaxID=296544 RepID=A0ABM7FXE6_9SPHN|nr:TonB-dependent receptor [Sphingomonas bisphenolicum]